VSAPLPNLPGDHRLGNDSPTVENPVRVAHAITTVLYLAAGLGWLTLPSPVVDIIATGGAFLLSTAAAEWARARVSPTGRITMDTIRGFIRAEAYDAMQALRGPTTPAEVQAAVAAAVTSALGPLIAAGQARSDAATRR